MEKWAKTLNQKAKGQPVAAPPPASSTAASTTPTSASNVSSPSTMASMSGSQVHSVTIGKSTEDLAFSMLQNKKDSSGGGLNNESSASGLSKLSGYGSDSGPETEDQEVDEQQFTDWSKLACLLCKRQFPSREKLTK